MVFDVGPPEDPTGGVSRFREKLISMFGFIGTLNSHLDRLTAARSFAAETSAPHWRSHPSPVRGSQLATFGGEASVLGTAATEDVRLCLLGAIHEPFPGKLVGSPLDDPNATARALLARYLDAGDRFLDMVVGSYCVCVLDGRDGSLLLARDPYGGSRLFVREVGNEVQFATRLIDFVGLLGQELRLDRSFEDFFLGFEFLPDDRTFYEGVNVLAKGTLVRWCDGRRTERAISAFQADPDLLASAGSSDQQAVISALHSAFIASLFDQCPSAGKIGILLGGFDSMLIAAVLKAAGREVETFTFRYREQGYTQCMVDEFEQLLGIGHNWVDINPQVIARGLEKFSQQFNQPVGQAHYLIATVEVAQVMSMRGINHCITGDGCDGLFLGYPTVHARARLIQRLGYLRGMLAPAIVGVGSSKWLEQRLGHPYRFGRNIGRVLGRPLPARGHIAACTLDQTSLRFLREDQPFQAESPEAVLRRLSAGLESVQPLRLAYLGKGRVGLNANKLEGAARSSGITFLSPYLHPRMAAVASLIPDELNRPSERGRSAATGKHIFMEMVDRFEILPPAFVHQPKMSPVTAPVDLWYWGELRDAVLQQLQGLPFAYDSDYAVSLVTPKAAEHWFREAVGISKYVNQAISLLVTYAAFTRYAQQPGSTSAGRK
jgi:asparagine synthetase B (glutamine-hydrolysing)